MTRLVLMCIRYAGEGGQEKWLLPINFLREQTDASLALFNALEEDSGLDIETKIDLLHRLCMSLFFPTTYESSDTPDFHRPINSFFLCRNLLAHENGRFNRPRVITPRINHIDYILRLVASHHISLTSKASNKCPTVYVPRL